MAWFGRPEKSSAMGRPAKDRRTAARKADQAEDLARQMDTDPALRARRRGRGWW